MASYILTLYLCANRSRYMNKRSMETGQPHIAIWDEVIEMTLHRTGAILKHYWHQRQPNESKWFTVNQGPMRRVIGTYFNFAISSFISHLPFTNCRTPLLDLCYKLFQHKLNGTRHKNKRIFPTININQNISHIFQHFPMISTIFSHVFPRRS
jgi:hypothetical protein